MKAENSGIRLSDTDAAVVKGMLLRGDRNHDIAAWFGVNPGRVADVKQGRTFPEIVPSPLSDFPPAGPYSSGKSLHNAAMALDAAKLALNNAMVDVEVALAEVRRRTDA
ncbi:hypothetical protein [Devosia sp. A449]